MRERYIAPAIMLIAGAITSIFNIVNNIEFLDSLKRLLIVLIIFYAIGKIAAKIIIKVTNDVNKPVATEKEVQIEEVQNIGNTAEKEDQ